MVNIVRSLIVFEFGIKDHNQIQFAQFASIHVDNLISRYFIRNCEMEYNKHILGVNKQYPRI